MGYRMHMVGNRHRRVNERRKWWTREVGKWEGRTGLDFSTLGRMRMLVTHKTSNL